MMHVEIEVLRPFWSEGRPRQIGEIVLIDRVDADYLVHLGRAARVDDSREAPGEPDVPRRRRKKVDQ